MFKSFSFCLLSLAFYLVTAQDKNLPKKLPPAQSVILKQLDEQANILELRRQNVIISALWEMNIPKSEAGKYELYLDANNDYALREKSGEIKK